MSALGSALRARFYARGCGKNEDMFYDVPAQRGPAQIIQLLWLEGTFTSSPAPFYPSHQAGKPSLSDMYLALSLNISGGSNSRISQRSLFHRLNSS